ncbi:hypothetical protein PRK78_004110 [Emydomyces testavorans]|uniref:SRR1-like domain-containing protein n=1 Tax=Emydomyces testavorans TaxID=2070801 RepID=A0AAF0DJA8_9EURO|nr:hypothetical protein PRK78_004110 [Emydomyces testavorans]
MDSESREEIEQKIRSLYEAGCPLFTKDAIRDVSEQLKQNGDTGQEILIKGLDGTIVDFNIETGGTQSAAEPELEYLMVTLRNKVTKEPVDPPVRALETAEEVEKYLNASVQAWEGSEQCRQLKSTLAAAITTPVKVTKIIGFACASVAVDYYNEHSDRRSPFQHALLLTIWNLLEKQSEHPGTIACYAQDPAYREADKVTLNKLGITVLEDPEAFLEVDDSSVVFSCAPNVPVKQIIADIARPALMIWDKVGEYQEGDDYKIWWVLRLMVKPKASFSSNKAENSTDPDSSRVREMIKNHYQELEFPSDRVHFGTMAIYVRKTTSANGNEVQK